MVVVNRAEAAVEAAATSAILAGVVVSLAAEDLVVVGDRRWVLLDGGESRGLLDERWS